MTTTTIGLGLPVQTAEGARYEMGERNTTADMIEAAAAHIGASVHWCDPKNRRLLYHATLALDGQEVLVEAGSPKWGARITSDDNSRSWGYHNSLTLAKAVRRRIRAAEARDKADKLKWERQHTYEASCAQATATAREELSRVLGAETVAACIDIDAECPGGEPPAVVSVKLYAGKIRARGMTVGEMIRFVTTLRIAGYDPIKMNEEDRKCPR